jgi:hypothetical protein
VESPYSILGWRQPRVLTSSRRRRWAAVAVGSGLLALSHVLISAWLSEKYSICWSGCTVDEQGGSPPFVESYLVFGIALWVLAPFSMARLSGRSLLGTVLWGCAAVAVFFAVFAAGELVTTGEATSLPGLTLAVAVAGAVLLPSPSGLDLVGRGVAIVLSLGLSLLLASAGVEVADWGILAALPALLIVGLADELTEIASRRA